MHVKSLGLVPYGPFTHEEAVVQEPEYRVPCAGGHHHGLHGRGDVKDRIVVRCCVVNLWASLNHRVGVESHA